MLFLGAGASAPFGIPTTPTLTKEVIDLLNASNQLLLAQIQQSHREHWGTDPNYEEILGYLIAYTNPAELRTDDYRISFANRNPQFRDKKVIEDLKEEIYRRVCNYCNQPFNKSADKYLKPDELESKFQITYDVIIGTYLYYERRQIIFSTNYDPSLEIWCQKRNIECIDGTRKTRNVEVNGVLNGFAHKEEVEKSVLHSPSIHDTLGLIRLHGSIWTYETGENHRIKFTTPSDLRMFSDLYNETLQKKPHLIFPGQEENMSRGEWDFLYQYYKDSLEGSCLFVGFSFRDETLSRPILDRLRNGHLKWLGVLSPHADKAVENLLKGENRLKNHIIVMESELGGRDAVELLTQKWFNYTGNMSIASSYSLMENLKVWKKGRDRTYLE
jgi:hypothetical protein